MKHVFVVCAYGKSPYLERCLRSLKGQSVPAKVYLATSTPSPYIDRIAEKYQVPVFVREGESSLKADWRFALGIGGREHSLVTIAHQDDIYGRDYKKKLMEAADRYGDLSVFASDYVVLKTREETAFDGTLYPAETKLVTGDLARLIKKILRLPLRVRIFSNRRFFKKSALMFGNSICCPSCTYNLDQTGSDLFVSDYSFALDWDNLLRLAQGPGRFVVCEEPLLAYRVHDGATTKQCIKDNRRSAEETEMYRKLWPKWMGKIFMHFYKKAYQAYE